MSITLRSHRYELESSTSQTQSTLRKDALRFFLHTMDSMDIQQLLDQAVCVTTTHLQIDQHAWPLERLDRFVIVAAGKAAVPMGLGMFTSLRRSLPGTKSIEGIIVGPKTTGDLPSDMRYFNGGHPLPNKTSLAAAHAALQLLGTVDERTLVLFLISGGASAMLESPLDEAFSMEEIAKFYETLVHSGLSITEMNILRKHFSAVKGGRLSQKGSVASQFSILINDVPGEAPEMVGSGPSLHDTSTIADCEAILSRGSLLRSLHPRVLRHFDSLRKQPEKDLDTGRANHDHAPHLTLLSNTVALQTLKGLAVAGGYYAEIDASCDDWESSQAAAHLVGKLRTLRKSHSKVCLISGGELSVPISGSFGAGGRNHHFVLQTALLLKRLDFPAVVLSAGSDGIDGNTPSAGAMADNFTCKRLVAIGTDPQRLVASFDSYTGLAALNDVLLTGPTGNNIRDIRILASV